MAAYFFDSSALVKRFSTESGSAWVLGIVRPSLNNFLAIATITGAEVVSALTRKLRGGKLSQRQYDNAIRRFERNFTARYFGADVTTTLVENAMRLVKKHGLRGYDSVQLAACLAVAENRSFLNLSPLTFVTADNDLNQAALAEGLTVENPNDHS